MKNSNDMNFQVMLCCGGIVYVVAMDNLIATNLGALNQNRYVCMCVCVCMVRVDKYTLPLHYGCHFDFLSFAFSSHSPFALRQINALHSDEIAISIWWKVICILLSNFLFQFRMWFLRFLPFGFSSLFVFTSLTGAKEQKRASVF